MKSYVQGLITGAAMIITMIILMGQIVSPAVSPTHLDDYAGDSGTYVVYEKNKIMDTRSGQVYERYYYITEDDSKIPIWEKEGRNVAQTVGIGKRHYNENKTMKTEPYEQQ